MQVRTVVREGAAGPALVDFADREDDLLVVATRSAVEKGPMAQVRVPRPTKQSGQPVDLCHPAVAREAHGDKGGSAGA